MAEYEIVLAAIVTSLFGIFGLLLINRNWFKKMRFKTELDLLKKKNNLEIKKLEKQLNLAVTPVNQKGEISQNNLLTQLAPLLKNLDGEQIAGLIDAFTGNAPQEGEGVPASLGELLQNIITENPEMIQGFLQGLNQGKNPSGGTTF